MLSQAAKCMDEKSQENQRDKVFHLFEQLPEGKIKFDILKYAAVDSLRDGTIGKSSVVCKGWQSFIKQHKIEVFMFLICQVYAVDPETCKRFLHGRLIYKPNENNDIGKIELKIVDLTNPLEGTFDLSKCGDTGQYLSIATGYRKCKKFENENKVEIWFVPRFVVENEINGSAKHFKGIFHDKWLEVADVGIIWTLGNWSTMNYYDYLTTQNSNELANSNLYFKWIAACYPPTSLTHIYVRPIPKLNPQTLPIIGQPLSPDPRKRFTLAFV